MYYYFEDKADLFVTVLRRYDEMEFFQRAGLSESTSAADYWRRFDAMLEEVLQMAAERDDLGGLGKAFYSIPKEEWSGDGALARFMGEKMDELRHLIEAGQGVGAIRRDLPVEVLQQLWMAINEVLERWVLAQWDDTNRAQRDALFRLCVDVFKRTFSPSPAEEP